MADETIPREGAITATVDLLRFPGPLSGGPVKLRVTIWSGPDFRTPTINRGAIFDDPGLAEWARDRVLGALGLLGVPVAGQDGREGLLSVIPEPGEYDRLSRVEAVERLVASVDPFGQLTAWLAAVRAEENPDG